MSKSFAGETYFVPAEELESLDNREYYKLPQKISSALERRFPKKRVDVRAYQINHKKLGYDVYAIIK